MTSILDVFGFGMGAEFYRDVFEPGVRAAREQGQSYEAIRDRLRRRWKPAAID